MDEDIDKYIEHIKTLAENKKINLQKELSYLENKILLEEERSSLDCVRLARHSDRLTTLEIIQAISDEYTELHGDRYASDDLAVVGGIARMGDICFTFIGQQKGHNLKENIYRNYGMMDASGYRKVKRLMQQAEKFNRPVISFINTPGAYPGVEAEQRGIGEAIAQNLKFFFTVRTPILGFILGEGGSGGALGIGICDLLYMFENSIYSVISPEGFASILLKDHTQIAQASDYLKLTSYELKKEGVIDGIIPEPLEGVHTQPEYMQKIIKAIIMRDLPQLIKKNIKQVLKDRAYRFEKLAKQYIEK